MSDASNDDFNEEFYQEFKEYWISNPKISKREAFRICGNKYVYNSGLSNYVNKRLRDDGLPLKHASGGRPKGLKNGETLYSISNKDEYESKYNIFLNYFHNSDLSQADILEKMNTTNGTSLHRYIQKRLKEDGLSVKERFREKQSKRMREETKNRRLKRWDENYRLFKNYWIHTDLYKEDIYKKLGVRPDRGFGRYVNNRLEEDGLPVQREHYRKTNRSIWDSFYEDIKDDWYESDYDIYTYLEKFYNIKKYNQKSRYLKNKAVDDGLIINNKKVKDLLTSESKEEYYNDIKKGFMDSDLSLRDYLISKNIYTNTVLFKYCYNRAKEDKLIYNGRKVDKLGRISNNRSGTFSVDICNYHIGTYGSFDEANKILNLARDCIFDEDKIIELKKQHPSIRVSETVKKNSKIKKYGNDATVSYINSKKSLETFFKERNVKKSTISGYEAALIKFFDVVNTNSLIDLVDTYFEEEEARIPVKDRSIKKDLINYRNYLINKELAGQSIRANLSKIKTLLRHFGVEIPELPQVKLDKSYVANYNDLPTKEMIHTACEQGGLLLKSIILFMSSSGSAKAETLSITVGMFLNGFKGIYFDEQVTNNNIYDILNLLKNKENLVPSIYLRRIKTDKYYFTCCTPESVMCIIEYLLNRKNLSLNSKLFDITDSKLSTALTEINDSNGWGFVGSYRRFRSHTLRKFMASNIKLPRDYVDALQGRSKDKIGEAYFKQDPKELRDIYISKMHNLMIYNVGIDEFNNNFIGNNEVKKFNISDELIKLSNLNKEGILTNEEFKNLKEKLLNEVL